MIRLAYYVSSTASSRLCLFTKNILQVNTTWLGFLKILTSGHKLVILLALPFPCIRLVLNVLDILVNHPLVIPASSAFQSVIRTHDVIICNKVSFIYHVYLSNSLTLLKIICPASMSMLLCYIYIPE